MKLNVLYPCFAHGQHEIIIFCRFFRGQMEHISTVINFKTLWNDVEEHSGYPQMPFGMYKGRPIKWVGKRDKGYLRWCIKNFQPSPLTKSMKKYL